MKNIRIFYCEQCTKKAPCHSVIEGTQDIPTECLYSDKKAHWYPCGEERTVKFIMGLIEHLKEII